MPFGLDMRDFPLGGDNLQFLIIKVLGLFSDDWAVVMNLYFLLSFVLICTTAYLVVRQLGLSRGLSLVVATLFSFLPYHFLAGELILSTYFAVPLGAFLVLDTLGWDVWGRPFLARAHAGPARGAVGCDGWSGPRWPLVIASAGSYYAPFTILLVVVADGAGPAVRRRPPGGGPGRRGDRHDRRRLRPERRHPPSCTGGRTGPTSR